MSLSRSPSPHAGGGWSSPGLVPGSGTSSPRPGTLSPASGISWAAARAKSDEVRGYPSFSTRNSGFFSRQKHKLTTRLPILRRLSSRDYVDKDPYEKEWRHSNGGGRSFGISMRRSRFKLLFAVFLAWIGYLLCWSSKFSSVPVISTCC
jgi:mannan polymerase II complex MNN10 subunit